MPYAEVNGQKTFYAARGPMGGTPVVFVHGAGGSHLHWWPGLAALGEYYRSYAPDLPGHGRSKGAAQPLVTAYSSFLYQFVLALGLNKFVLVGHSMGGGVAQHFALEHQDMLMALILLDTGARLRVSPKFLETYRRGEHSGELVTSSYAPGTPDRLLRLARQEEANTSPELYYTDFLACDSFDALDRVREIKVPTLAMCGAEDNLTPVMYTEFLGKAIKGAKMAIIPDAGHQSMLEQPQRVCEEILMFLKTLPL